MNIYTKTGDFGETFNLCGEKVSKNDCLIHFIGTVDELSSHLGLVKATFSNTDTCQFLERIQKNLVSIMAHASDPANEKYFFNEDETAVLEKEIDRLSDQTVMPPGPVLPGRDITEAHIHITRTVARRTERLFFAANALHPLCQKAGAYLNRLSDYLFVLSR